MELVLGEIWRIMKRKRHMALYIADFYSKKKGFIPAGFMIFGILSSLFRPVEIVAVTRHNKDLKKGNYHKAAEEENFFLRGFNYLFIMYKE